MTVDELQFIVNANIKYRDPMANINIVNLMLLQNLTQGKDFFSLSKHMLVLQAKIYNKEHAAYRIREKTNKKAAVGIMGEPAMRNTPVKLEINPRKDTIWIIMWRIVW